jgi:glutathione S-transferase
VSDDRPPVGRVLRIPFSTNVERVALALGHKGFAVDWVDVDPVDRTPVRALSSQDLVPVLEDDRGVHVDSTAIIRYLEKRYPEAPLYPADEARAAEIGGFVDWFDRVWKRPPNEIEAELGRAQPDRSRIAELERKLHDSLAVFESLLADRDYLFGAFSAGDCAAFPFLKYARLHDPADDELFHAILAENLALDGGFPRLAAWIARVDEHPRA